MTDRLWTKGFILLIAVQTVDMLTYYMVAPVIAKYALEQGVIVALSGLAATMFAVVSIVARPISGVLSDSVGRKRILIAALAVSCLAQLGYAFVPTFELLLVLRAVHGLFYALFGTAISAMAIDSLPESRRSEGMGWFGTAYVFGSVVGPLLGVYLSDEFGFRVMFLTACAMAAVGFVMGLFLRGGELPNRDASQVRKRLTLSSFFSVRCIPYALIMCLISIIWSVVTTYIVIVADARGIVGAAAFFAVNSIALFVTRPFWGKMADKHGIKVTFLPAVVFEAAALILLAVSQQLWVMLLAGFVKAGGTGGVLPSLQAECGKQEPERTGVAMSMYYLGGDIGYAVGPLIGGVSLDMVGTDGLFWTMLPFVAMYGIVFVYLTVRMRREKAR
ncbi:MAG: MFS transporter [Eggerthellaceae bacterium]|nr:MFS transporter [Eggerthellaceae bacterium]